MNFSVISEQEEMAIRNMTSTEVLSYLLTKHPTLTAKIEKMLDDEYDAGYDIGFEDGRQEGYDEGYNEGFDDGKGA